MEDYTKLEQEREERRRNLMELVRKARLAAKPIFAAGEKVWRYKSSYTTDDWVQETVKYANKSEVVLENLAGTTYHFRPIECAWVSPNRSSSIYKLDDPLALARIEDHKRWQQEKFERNHPMLEVRDTSIFETIEAIPCARHEAQGSMKWQTVTGVEMRFGGGSMTTVTFATSAQLDKLISDLEAARNLIARARVPESDPLPPEKCWMGWTYNERGEKIKVSVPPSDEH